VSSKGQLSFRDLQEMLSLIDEQADLHYETPTSNDNGGSEGLAWKRGEEVILEPDIGNRGCRLIPARVKEAGGVSTSEVTPDIVLH
jgi:hypothetical protein